MPTPAIQTLINDAQQVLNLDSISAVRSVVAVSLANANTGTPLNPNLTTQQLWNEFYQVVTRSKSDIESIIANQMMKFIYNNNVVNVKNFGAKGDGVTDDTAAIQAAITYVCPLGYGLLFPNGTYKITASLKIPVNTSGWSFFGSAQGTEIVQHTVGGNGQAIFEFAGGDISQFNISNLKLRWNDVNPQSGYKACAFWFNWDGVSSKNNGVYNFRIDNVFATFGFRFFSNYNTGLNTSSGVNVWGWNLDRCTSNYMNGGMVRLTNAGSGGSPNCSVKDSYILGNTAGQPPESSGYIYSEPQFFCDSANGWQFSNVEINAVATSVYLILISGAASLEYNNCRVESVFFTTSFNSGISWTSNIGTNVVSFDYSRCIIKAAQTVTLFRHNAIGNDKLTIGTLDNNQNPGYPAVILQAGAVCYLVGGTAGAIAVASNITACANANRYEATAPVWDGNRKWQRVAAFTSNYTPFASYINSSVNYWEITSPGAAGVLTINDVFGAFEGQEYVFDIINSGGTLTAITWGASYRQDGTAVPVGAGKRKTIRFIYVNGLFIQIGATSASF